MPDRADPAPRLGTEPSEDPLHDTMTQVAAAIDKTFNGGATGQNRVLGFILMTFPFEGGPGQCNYISNVGREDVMTLLREQLAHYDGQAEQSGRA